MKKEYKNRVELTGQLTKVFRTHTFDNGGTTCTFGLMTKKQFKKRDGTEKEVNTYHTCVANNKLQQTVSKLSSGDWIDLVGTYQSKSYEKNGEKKYTTEIFITEILDTDSIPQQQEDGPIDMTDVPF